MPITNGQYVKPTWVNEAPPFISADAMGEMTDTLSLNQRRSSDITLSLDGVSPFSSAESVKTAPSVNIEEEYYNNLQSLTLTGSNISSVALSSTLSITDSTEVETSLTDNGDFFAFVGGDVYKTVYAHIDNSGNISDIQYDTLFPNLPVWGYTPTNIHLSINKRGIGIAYCEYGYDAYGIAYTYDGGKSWSEGYYDYTIGNLKSLCVTDNGCLFMLSEVGTVYKYADYKFLSGLNSFYRTTSYPFGENPTLNHLSNLTVNENGYGIVFDTTETFSMSFTDRRYAYTTDNGSTWTVKSMGMVLPPSSYVANTVINSANRVAFIGKELPHYYYMFYYGKVTAEGFTYQGSGGIEQFTPYRPIRHKLAKSCDNLMGENFSGIRIMPPFSLQYTFSLLKYGSCGATMNNKGFIGYLYGDDTSSLGYIGASKISYPTVPYGYLITSPINPTE